MKFINTILIASTVLFASCAHHHKHHAGHSCCDHKESVCKDGCKADKSCCKDQCKSCDGKDSCANGSCELKKS